MLWKAESEKKRPAILAKLAKGTASLYHKAINHFRTGLVRFVLCCGLLM